MTECERIAIAEGTRLRDMYHPDTRTAEIGRAILTVCQRYRKGQQHVRQLIWIIERIDPAAGQSMAVRAASQWLDGVTRETTHAESGGN